ncbi:hypothetical protein [Govanella unica]|uniref:Uncharacterized protein n=1 Tax=Govanella unica TaxID=2975056 RepID=A0A9X3Z7W0_9PROT|nr:hypothetical protein [Govania unica]MDA5194670.1 hypothetical protein [Govania unica]
MTEKKLPTPPLSTPDLAFCPACGSDLTLNPQTGGRACRSCGLRALAAPIPAKLGDAPQTPLHGATEAIVGRLEQSPDPARPLLDMRAKLGPGGILYLEIGAGGLWEFPKKSLMLLMERCGFRLIRKFDRDGRRGLYRRY